MGPIICAYYSFKCGSLAFRFKCYLKKGFSGPQVFKKTIGNPDRVAADP